LHAMSSQKAHRLGAYATLRIHAGGRVVIHCSNHRVQYEAPSIQTGAKKLTTGVLGRRWGASPRANESMRIGTAKSECRYPSKLGRLSTNGFSRDNKWVAFLVDVRVKLAQV
jgi:hypothetical protein